MGNEYGTMPDWMLEMLYEKSLEYEAEREDKLLENEDLTEWGLPRV